MERPPDWLLFAGVLTTTKAAKAYDKAAIKLRGVEPRVKFGVEIGVSPINFDVSMFETSCPNRRAHRYTFRKGGSGLSKGGRRLGICRVH